MNITVHKKTRWQLGPGCVKWLSRIVIVAVAIPVGLLAIGFIYETIASRSDWDRYPPPGEMVDIGGYSLHLNCTGERRAGQPVVVLEAGSGSASPDWVLVQSEVEEFARVCSYDRAGLAWSDPGPQPRSSQQYASELHTLLEKAGDAPPFILVAHSYGGHTVRIYAQEHPQDVAAMVLVDSRLPSVEIQTDPRGAGQLRMWGLLARCGFFRLVGKRTLETEAPAILERIPDYPFPIVWDPDFFETSRLETLVTADSDRQARETGPFGDLPLVVIAHEIPDLFSHLPPDEMQAAEAEYQAGQMDLTDLSTNSQFLIAKGGGHNIPVENPGTIVAAVRAVIEEHQ